MKVTVTEAYQDKFTNEHHYAGEILDIKDLKRANELVDAGVVKVADLPKETVKKTTSKK